MKLTREEVSGSRVHARTTALERAFRKRMLIALSAAAILTGLTALNEPATSGQSDAILPGARLNRTLREYPLEADAPHLIARLLSPVAVEAVQRKLHSSGKALKAKTLDLSAENFVIYVPQHRPAPGYGLLVFVPPWSSAEMPSDWTEVMEHSGTIFVSAGRSGNDAQVLERRVPLALVALANIRTSFSIDPARTVVGGFSGGSRVALRIALAYPDLFSGVLLNAGSDPIAQNPDHLPARDLLERFRRNTAIAYVTGDADSGSLALDSASQSSMNHWCVSNVTIVGERGTGHETAPGSALERALDSLFARRRQQSSALQACRVAREKEVGEAIAEAQRAIVAGDRSRARRMILTLDAKYGGLAAPASVRLADRCNCGIFDAPSGQSSE